jgi:phospho-N-acetylmuramoyl-pentapeptide-transferase
MIEIKIGLISLCISFVIVYLMGPVVIPMLKRLKFGQSIREEGPQSHLKKSGTPTMGGILFITGSLLTGIVISLINSSLEILPWVGMLLFGLVGFIDDFLIIKRKHNLGLRAWQKIVLQVTFALVITIYAGTYAYGTELYIPFITETVNVGWWYYPITFIALVGTVNAVNLTDGLDGLASGVTVIVMSFFMVVTAMSGEPGLIIFIGALIGGVLGFLRYNAYPAQIFMGDTGSMALGGAVVTTAIMTQTQIFIIIVGGIYLIEALSVIIQVSYFKISKGKRVFRMAPIHHHFELKGWHETKVVVTFWIVTGILVSIGLLGWL